MMPTESLASKSIEDLTRFFNIKFSSNTPLDLAQNYNVHVFQSHRNVWDWNL